MYGYGAIGQSAIGESLPDISLLVKRVTTLENAITQALPNLRSSTKSTRNKGIKLLENALAAPVK